MVSSVIRHAATLTALILAGCLIAPTQAIPGQPGTLDATWASASPIGAGKLMVDFAGWEDAAHAVMLQPDGKIVLSGTCSSQACLVRLLSDGTLDTTFNGTGKVTTTLAGSYADMRGAALQPDRKIITAGNCITANVYQFCVARYLPSGALDTSFGGTGYVSSVITANNFARTAMLQPDGKILVAGECTGAVNKDFCVVRYLGDGQFDSGFGVAGKAIFAMDSGSDTPYAMQLLPDGKIIVVGECGAGSQGYFCIARLLANGSLDTSFKFTGKVLVPAGTGSSGARAVALQPDGRLVLAGDCENGTFHVICIVRLLANGDVDTSFSGDGELVRSFGSGIDRASSIHVLPDARILVVGHCATGNGTVDFCGGRVTTNGETDDSFASSGGFATVLSIRDDVPYASLMQPDGKLVVAGSCGGNSVNGMWDLCVARYDGGPFNYRNCTLDVDGDGAFLANDALINMRVVLGVRGNAVVAGINFASQATRNSWLLIREHLVTHCGLSLTL